MPFEKKIERKGKTKEEVKEVRKIEDRITLFKRPTAKQREFLRHYLRTGNAYQSALAAGYSESMAKSASANILKSDAVRAMMDYIGLDDVRLFDEIKKVLDAEPEKSPTHSEKINAIKLAASLRGLKTDEGQNKKGDTIQTFVKEFYVGK